MGIVDTPPKHSFSPGLRRLVVRLGLATDEQVALAVSESPSRKLLAALAACEIIDEDLALDKVSVDLGIERIDVLQGEYWKNPFVADALQNMERGFAVSYRVVPIKNQGENIIVAMADPLDTEAISSIEFILGKRVRCALASEKDILTLLNKLADSELLDEGGDELQGLSLGGQDMELIVEPEEDTALSVKVASESKPVVRLVNKMLADALEQKASDIHLEPTSEGMEVRLRIDGVMQSHLSIPKRLQGYVTTRFKILAGMDITEKRRPQDGRFRISVGKHTGGDARVSSVPTPFGEKLVLRLLNTNLGALSLDTLGLTDELRERFIRVLSARDRMVVVTGPTGSGKSTTLYAAIQQLKEGTTNIITVEDPIEYRIPGITQIQVNQKVEMTFAKGLRSILRQDPDIIMVGEIRDLETAEVACQAAQTGHLVLSTLHTNTAPSAVVRLEDLGLEPFVVASSLGAVLAQRLVRRLCEACAKECSDDEKARISRKYGINAERTRTSVGCRECDLSGYRGRIGLYSLLVINEELRELIRKGASESKIEEAGLRHGMSTMEAEAKRLIASGVTTLEEIERVLGARERDLVEDDKQREISLADSETSVDTHMIELGELENIEDFRSLFSESNEDFVFDSGVNEITTPGIISAPSSQSIAGLAESFYVQEESTRKNTVLLVDDDEGVRVVLSRIFKNEGYVVHQAFDALDAFAKLQDCEPDLVVSDLVMPGFDGEEFVKRLRTNPKTVRTPVVMLTGSDSKEHEARARKAGVDEFLSKTLSPQIVLERVRMLLKK